MEVARLQTRQEFGREPESLSFNEINAFYDGQIRRTYDPEGIRNLANSISENDLLHPLTVAELSRAETKQYVDDLNSLWNKDYSVGMLAQNYRGNYYLLIAGHRRLMAVSLLADENPHIQEFYVKCSVRSGISLTEAFRLQYAENSHQSISPSADAQAILMYYRRRRAECEANGQKYPKKQCAQELAISPTKVTDSEKYFDLPVEIRRTVDAGLYSFSRVLRLAELNYALVENRIEWDESDRANELIFALLVGERENMGPSAFSDLIKARVYALQAEQMQLDMLCDEATPELRKNLEAVRLVLKSLESIQLAMGHLALGQLLDFRTNGDVTEVRESTQQTLDMLRTGTEA